MQLDSSNTQVIDTPEKERLDVLIDEVFSARTTQIPQQVAPGKSAFVHQFLRITACLAIKPCDVCQPDSHTTPPTYKERGGGCELSH